MHADPHGGNLLLTPDGRIAYLDFGLLLRGPRGPACCAFLPSL